MDEDGRTSEITHRGPVFAVERRRFREAGGAGRAVVRDVVRHPGAVVIVPVLEDGRLIMIRNYRASVDESLIEFPAGKLERGEAPHETAARELEEETGYRAGLPSVRLLGKFYTSPGLTDELMHAFEATDLEEVGQRLQPGEEIEVQRFAADAVAEMIAQGEIKDGKTIAAFYLWRSFPSPLGRGVRGEGERDSASIGLSIVSTDQGSTKPPVPPHLLEYARALRVKYTDAERLMWGLLRDRRLLDVKFRRQHPIDEYILDFYCDEIRLAIELDGGQHNEGEARVEDEVRSARLAFRGIHLLRFWNHEVLKETEAVLEAIGARVQNALAQRHIPSPRPSPGARGGRA